MDLLYKRLEELKPYEKNPRKNDEAVKYVAESIKQFGFKVPIVIDKNGIIVAGHTRYKAAKKLNLKEVPCIIADDLNDEQIKAFRLADNKVAEKSEWDFDLLDTELDDLIDFDMTVFGFDEAVEDEPEYKLNGGTYICYTSDDFVLHTDITEPVVFDMELYAILSMGFTNVTAIKIISDNLSLEEYENITNC